MNRAVWIAQKNELCALIKRASDAYGGDDIEWLRDYTKELIEANKDNLQAIINILYSDYMVKNYEPVKSLNSFKTNVCENCGYVPPFCYGSTEEKCTKEVLRETMAKGKDQGARMAA